MATTLVSGVQYSGIWTMQQVDAAIAAGTWPTAYNSGSLYAWGRNINGVLGQGNTTNYSSPKQVGALANWVNANGGQTHVLAAKTDGTLWSWGQNNFGQLGLGNTTYRSSPNQIGALTNWLIASAGIYHSVAIKTDGTMWSWGRGNYGQLGDGTVNINKSSPVQIGALTSWLSVSCGTYFALAVRSNGTLWGWGDGTSGQLGQSNQTSYSSPKQVGALTTWASVSANAIQSYAIKTDGTLWSWGANTWGQLGLGGTTYYSSPKQVGSLTNWLKVVGGNNNQAIAVKTDGTLWSWGRNNTGALGLGNTTNYSSPKQVGALTNWSKNIATFSNGVGVIKQDGTLWTWGSNTYGDLGLNNQTSYSSPKQVGSGTTWYAISQTSQEFLLGVKG